MVSHVRTFPRPPFPRNNGISCKRPKPLFLYSFFRVRVKRILESCFRVDTFPKTRENRWWRGFPKIQQGTPKTCGHRGKVCFLVSCWPNCLVFRSFRGFRIVSHENTKFSGGFVWPVWTFRGFPIFGGSMATPEERGKVYSAELKPNLVRLILTNLDELPMFVEDLRELYVIRYKIELKESDQDNFERRFRNAIISLERTGLSCDYVKAPNCTATRKRVVQYPTE